MTSSTAHPATILLGAQAGAARLPVCDHYSGVEVRIDGGSWQEATLAKVPNIDTWVQWTWQWDADKGDHTIEARATNSEGVPQTDEIADVLPDGATGYPGIRVTVT